MSGPGLVHVDSHSAIHEAAIYEAEEINNILSKLLKDGQIEKALEAAYVAVEHWESRTLKHADAEEEGLYKDIVDSHPAQKDKIAELTRDHTLLRLLVDDIKEMLDTEGMNEIVLQKFHALVHVDLIHNKEEEAVLARLE